MAKFIQSLANGLNLGSIYALTALGYTMVYGIIRMINYRLCVCWCSDRTDRV